MNTRLRWFKSFAVITLVALAGILFLNALSPTGQTAPVVRSPIYTTGGFTFGSIQHLLPNAPLPLGFQDVEPEIKVDIFGNIYVTAIEGVPAGVDFWKSTDQGASFVYMGQPDGAQCPTGSNCTNDAGLGGGDDSIDVSAGGYLYVSSLWLGSATMSASYDGGTGGVLPGQKWEVNPVAAAIPSDDRQWVAAYGPQTVYMSYRQILAAGANASNVIFVAKSTDGGKTFPQQVATFPATSAVTARREGNLAIDPYNGNVYTSFRPQELNGHTRAELWFLKSTDGGSNWALTQIYQGPTGTDIGNVFPVIAVDRGGNIHLAFSQCDFNSTTGTSSNCKLYLMSSADQGNTWLAPVQVNNGPDTTYAILPWMVAGSPGVVDITWYGANITDSTQAANWHMYFAQATNVLSTTPTFSQVQALPQIVHNQDICLKGGACGSTGNRRLAEYYQVTLDPDGNANIAFSDTVTANTTGFAQTWYTKQTSGPSAYNPPAPPGPATFAANVTANSGGAEPNAWVDSYNCIYGGRIGGPVVMKSTDNGLSFTAKTVTVGTGTHGGDFDIITIPQASGARPDFVYTADLGITSVHIGKSTDGGATYASPGTGGSAGEVSVSSDRMWLYPDRIGADQFIYLMDHELASETIRFSASANDMPWVTTDGLTEPELFNPATGTLPNTNPGPVFVDRSTGTPASSHPHTVYGLFGASIPATNVGNPPFGKMPNAWDAVGAAPLVAGALPGPFSNHPIFKGLIDSPSTAPAGTTTYGNHVGSLWPSGHVDSAGNVYAVWATNSARANTVQTGTSTPSTTFDIWFAASHDGGVNFYGPWRVSSGVGASTFAWIAAGDAGRVDIVWYQSNNVPPPLVASPTTPGALTGGTNNMPAGSTWNVMFAQSLNANSREPVFTVSKASDHIIHTGSISNGGLTGSSDRSLLDFFEVAIGPDGLANIFNADNGVSAQHINYIKQNGGPLALTNPSAITCLPIPPLTKVESWMTHGSITPPFKINFPLPPMASPRGVECRSSALLGAGNYMLVFTFLNNLTSVANATITSHDPATGTGSVCGSGLGPGLNQYTVNLCGVSTGQYITVTLNSVLDALGNSGNILSPSMGFLVGDVNFNGVASNADVSLVKAQVAAGASVDSSNFQDDINANGVISNADVSLTKAQVAAGAQLPSPP